MQTFKLPPPETQIIVNLIEKRVGPCSIFAFGYKNNTSAVASLLSGHTSNTTTKHHFNLVVFSNKAFPNGAANIANTIAETTNSTSTATILLHKATDLATKQPHQQYFFDNILRHGQRLALDTTAPPYLLHNAPARDQEADTAYWLKCEAVALFNSNAATASQNLNVGLCKIALLNTACVQIALGLIRLKLGYTPNEFGLNYLLNLCGSFTDLPAKLFHHQTPDAIKRYKMLCAPSSMLNHWYKLNAPEEDVLYLLDATQ